MIQLLRQVDVRPARDLPFCYLCGEAITCRADRHPDHIPPRAIFAVCDRGFPLKVAAHRDCNAQHSPTDRQLGQLIAIIHGKHPDEDDVALQFEVYDFDGSEIPFLGFVGGNLIGQIGRWVRGFHAALYGEFLPHKTRSALHPPFPHGSKTEDGFYINDIPDQQYLFVEIIKKNRLARIVCNNDKTVYECTWVQMDVHVSYPRDVPNDFLREFQRLVNGFDKHVRMADRHDR